MAAEFDVELDSEGRVIVILHADCQISKDEILALLRESGVDIEKVTFCDPGGELSELDLENTSTIIPLDAETCDLPELEVAALRCSDAGGRVVAVFGPIFSYEGMHPIADKYGTQCGWSPSDLASCIAGPDGGPVLDVTGTEVQRPTPNQVKCG